MVKISTFDPADYLKDPLTIAAYLAEAVETDDPSYIRVALDTAARVREITDIANTSGPSRETP